MTDESEHYLRGSNLLSCQSNQDPATDMWADPALVMPVIVELIAAAAQSVVGSLIGLPFAIQSFLDLDKYVAELQLKLFTRVLYGQSLCYRSLRLEKKWVR